jgi:uncharacterized FAD-dependent dehydrogenase
MEPKPFAIGLRVEHPQVLINEIQYGPVVRTSKLPRRNFVTACGED